MASPPSVAVIGAGPCGLAACKALSEARIPFDCFEAGQEIGGVWNVGKRPGGYRSLMTNTSNPNMAYPDFPFAEDDPTYLTAAELCNYFQRYVEHHGFADKIHFGQRLTTASKDAAGRWLLHFEGGESRKYDALVVATGQFSLPRNPHEDIPGEFTGEFLHSHDYFDVEKPVDMRDRRVLVVGLGTSAAEIAAELSDLDHSLGHASQLSIAVRSGRWVLPKVFNGEPTDAKAPHSSERPPGILKSLPTGIGSFVARRVMAKGLKALSGAHGGHGALGLPEPSMAPWEDRPTLSFDFIPALQEGRIDVRPGIERFDGKTVFVTDGSSAEFDVIVYATGYDMHIPFLSDEVLGSSANDLALYQRIAHPSQENLFFIGYCRVMCALWPVAEQQSRWLAKVLTDKVRLPGPQLRKRRAVAVRHTLPVMCNMYVEDLRREAGGTL